MLDCLDFFEVKRNRGCFSLTRHDLASTTQSKTRKTGFIRTMMSSTIANAAKGSDKAELFLLRPSTD